jgi:transposase
VRKRRVRHPGRKRIDDRRTLAGILFVLRTGIAWQQLPQELEYGSGMTCWRTPQGMATGRRVPGPTRTPALTTPRRRTPRPLHGGLRLRLAAGASGGEKTGPSPVDRRKLGSKRHLITDANGIPLACLLTAANRNDITQLLPLLEAIPPIRGTVGRPRQRPSLLLADRGYDSNAHRQALRARGIRPVIARRKTAHGSGLGSDRWVVERTLSWLRQHRRLRIRYERTAEIHEAFLSLACSLICLRTLSGPFC